VDVDRIAAVIAAAFVGEQFNYLKVGGDTTLSPLFQRAVINAALIGGKVRLHCAALCRRRTYAVSLTAHGRCTSLGLVLMISQQSRRGPGLAKRY
jgi:hypothetical protein